MQAKLQMRHQELTQTTPDQPVDDEEVYYKVAGDCPKGCVYSLRSLWRKKRRYVDPDASTSQMLAQRGMGNFMILSTPKELLEGAGDGVGPMVVFSSLEVMENQWVKLSRVGRVLRLEDRSLFFIVAAFFGVQDSVSKIVTPMALPNEKINKQEFGFRKVIKDGLLVLVDMVSGRYLRIIFNYEKYMICRGRRVLL
ncbi:hypothetical protein Scep_004180 [Stephania cephalantha]|uniref:Uncharacterized protein n=1 Tax=Stephania cephalantha TaxID=152367 RepID=A0AAP0KS30_9MAGN